MAAYPYFYMDSLGKYKDLFELDEATSKHAVQVLRMKAGEKINLTDGRGLKYLAVITNPDRKHCEVKVENAARTEKSLVQFELAIAFTKFNSRNEWMLEKCTEIGIGRIIPLITERSEKEKLKIERLRQILVAAMLQSQQVFLPELTPAFSFKQFIASKGADEGRLFIAHCVEDGERCSYRESLEKGQSATMMIGPEGDFTPAEIALAMAGKFTPVTLGPHRLRTETAGLYSCTVFNAVNFG